MPRIRFAAAGVIISGLFLGGLCAANAQSAMGEPVGQPMQLLNLMHPGKGAARAVPANQRLAGTPHRKSHHAGSRLATSRAATSRLATSRPAGRKLAAARRVHARSAVAVRKPRPNPRSMTQLASAAPEPPAVPATPAADADWPAAPQLGIAQIGSAPPPPPAPVLPTPKTLIIGGKTVQVSPPSETNELDLAADDQADPAGGAPSSTAVASAADNDDDAKATDNSPSATAQAVNAREVSAQTAEKPASPIGTTSWILQVMAALGGAVAAGSAAWFLIASAPPRTYV